VACNAHPRSEYEAYSNIVTGTATYHHFLEKKSASPYKLVQGMDYLDRNGNGIPENYGTEYFYHYEYLQNAEIPIPRLKHIGIQ